MDETLPAEYTASVLLKHRVGLHARPSVKLTKLAKTYPEARIEIATDGAGPWTDAKSIVRVMGMKIPKNTVLHFRGSGPGSQEAIAALVALVERDFDEDAH